MLKEIDNNFVADDSSNASVSINKNQSAEQILRDELLQWDNFKQYLKQAYENRN